MLFDVIYLLAPGGITIQMVTISADRPIELKIEINVKLRMSLNTKYIIKYRRIAIESIIPNEVSKKKCNKIPIVSHA